MKNCILALLLSVLGTTSLKAQFNQQQIITRGFLDEPRDSKSFDLDGDGDMDILTCSKRSGSYYHVVWYKNDGMGVFYGQNVISEEVLDPYGIHAADLDGDGDLDVLSASNEDDKIAWYENDGAGNFGTQQIITAISEGARNVYSADLDGDGDMDVLSASYIDSTIAWYENDGVGNFGDQFIISDTIPGAWDVFATDIDGDGDMDVLSSSGSLIAWYENDGVGSFGPPGIISASIVGGRNIHSSDLDGDGDMDVISTSYLNDRIGWHENDGVGGFEPIQIVSSTADNGVYDVYTSDLDEDGDQDIISAAYIDGAIAWYENDGMGNFGPTIILTEECTGATCVYCADLDVDGDVDIFASSLSNDKIIWFENDGVGSFSSFVDVQVSTDGAHRIHAADLDGDGDIDPFSTSFEENVLGWFENNGDGNFGHQQIIEGLGGDMESLFAADLDGDGDLDILAAGGSPFDISWVQNDGTGNFSAPMMVSNSVYDATGIHVADLDGDGDLDVVAGSSWSDFIAWFENDGDGNFGPISYIDSDVTQAKDVYSSDLDGDGDFDVLSLSNSPLDRDLAWYDNDGEGNFGPKQIIIEDVMGPIMTFDADGDGDMDVLTQSRSEDLIIWVENDGTGTFIANHIITGVGLSSAQWPDFSPVDIDLDGDLDVVSGTPYNGRVAWYENDGFGFFGPQQNIWSRPSQGGKVYVSDLDSDGDLDVLSALPVSWFENKYEERIKGKIYYDENENGSYDYWEIGLSSKSILSMPESDFTFTDTEGSYYMYFSSNFGSYDISPVDIPHWSVITDPLSYEIDLDGDFTYFDSLDFGFFPDSLVTEVKPTLTGGFPRCNTIINYWLNFENIGTVIPSGIVNLTLDDSVDYITSEIIPDSIVGQHIYWHFDSLSYFTNEQLIAQVEMPNFESIGDTLTSYLSIYVLDDLGEVSYISKDTLEQILVCAYDPNDKIATPAGEDSLGLITPDTESLDYTIRFQNTGNDTAITVVIKDQLDRYLNWSTLDLIASSHDMNVQVDAMGEVIFTFENIMLPDSVTNELASHGFVRYQIDLAEEVPLGTSIYNTAEIYFDANPAVITNTKINTIACWDFATLSLFGEDDSLLCVNDSSILLESDKPDGLFEGIGVLDGEFDPILAGEGMHSIYYVREVNECLYNDFIVVTVLELPEVIITPFEDDSLCLDNPFLILDGTPEDGLFSGTGVLDTVFTPSEAEIGYNTIYLTYENESGCVGIDSIPITILELPEVSFVTLEEDSLCLNSPVTVLNASPEGGLFSGPGILEENFNADLAGEGMHTLYYTFENEYGCGSFDSAFITVLDIPTVILTPPIDIVCLQEDSISLNGTPDGGVFSGSGVAGTNFIPNEAGEGTHTIYYTFEDELGCKGIDSVDVNVTDCLGVSEELIQEIIIYPNPFSGFTILNFGKELEVAHSVIIYDILGQLVYRNENVVGSSLKIENKNLVSGSYILSLFNSNSKEIFTTKLMVE